MWAERGGVFTFLDLSKFLQGGGYEMINQAGSERRFELRAADGSYLDTIVFHDYHGRRERKVGLKDARQWWGRRIKNHVDVVLG